MVWSCVVWINAMDMVNVVLVGRYGDPGNPGAQARDPGAREARSCETKNPPGQVMAP
jgi:hypothetical protein